VVAFRAFVLVALLVDFFALNKQGAHRVSMKEATVWSLVWVAVSSSRRLALVYLGGTGADAATREVANTKALSSSPATWSRRRWRWTTSSSS